MCCKNTTPWPKLGMGASMAEPVVLPPIADPPSPEAPHRDLRWVFVGTQGIRAGWSLLVYVVLLVAVAIPVTVFVVLSIGGHLPTTAQQSFSNILIGETPLLEAVLMAGLGMSLLEKRDLFAYWLADRKALGHFASGTLLGLISLATLVLILNRLHLLVFDFVILNWSDAVFFGFYGFVAFLLVAMLEETLFRGYVHFTLTRGLNLFWSSVLTSLVFALAHVTNAHENWVGIASVLAAGILFCFTLRLTGSLLFAIGFHAAWDWAQSYLFGVADSGATLQGRLMATHPMGNPLWSGGSAGPEGSILVFPVMALAAIACLRLYAGQAPPRMDARR